MKEVKIEIPVGLHARPAATFCTEAKKYQSDITVAKEGKSYNAKSVMMIMTAGIEFGDVITIEAKGSDANQAEDGLVELLATIEE